MITQILLISILIVFVGFWLYYLVDAFKLNALEGILTLLVPAYVLYFAFIKSQRRRPYALALSVVTCLMFSLLLVIELAAA
jgi:hypothetical protein